MGELLVCFSLKSNPMGDLSKICVACSVVMSALIGCGGGDDPAARMFGGDGGVRQADLGMVPPDAEPSLPPESVSVATFNVRKFFDTNCDSRNCGEGSFERMPSESEFRAKAQQIANGINFLGGDILLLQEIETEICLNTLMEFLAEEGYTTSVLGETGGRSGIGVPGLQVGAPPPPKVRKGCRFLLLLALLG